MSCQNPIRISKPSIGSSFIRRVYDAKLPKVLRDKVVPYTRNTFLVPCGKCVDCLKRKQNDLAVRCVRQAERSGNMVFVTLTYDDDKLPISCTTQLVDKSTGEVFNSETPVVGLYPYERGNLFNQVAGYRPRYSYQLDEDYDDYFACQYTFTPSLSRSDFRLYLKRERVRYERYHKEKLPEFKYVAVGEYGPKTCRPHMHIAFFGLDIKIVQELFKKWSEDFGYIQVKQVKYLNDDKTFGYAIASKYVGKYMCKGKFDCESVIKGLVEKPRICISRDFGNWLTPELISYYRAYDLFGRYNINDISRFSEVQLEMLCNELCSRSRVNVYGYRYMMPDSMKKKLFYNKTRKFNELTKKFELRYEASQVQAIRLALLQNVFAEQLLSSLRNSGVDFSPEDFAFLLSQETLSRKISAENDQALREKDFLRSYASSIF